MLSALAAGHGKPLEKCVSEVCEAVRGWCAPVDPPDDVSILGLAFG
jgi:hypothetical protein